MEVLEKAAEIVDIVCGDMWEVLDQLPSEKCSKELLTMSTTSMVYGRRAVGASELVDKSKVIHVLDEDIPTDVFRQDVGGIVTTRDFLQPKILLTDSILDPKIRCG